MAQAALVWILERKISVVFDRSWFGLVSCLNGKAGGVLRLVSCALFAAIRALVHVQLKVLRGHRGYTSPRYITVYHSQCVVPDYIHTSRFLYMFYSNESQQCRQISRPG